MSLPKRVRFLNFFRQVWKIRPLESWLAGKTRGRRPDSLPGKLAPNPYQYPKPTYRLLSRDGVKLKVDISDYIGHYLYFGFADAGADKLFSLCGENYKVVDVGANIGWTALRLARIAHRGKVICFEPDPFNAARCLENAELNALSNLEVLAIGLGDESKSVNLEVRTPSNLGGNRVAPGNSNPGNAVDIRRLDDVEAVRNLSGIDLMKIDVEGYELKVIRGAKQLLTSFKPVLFVELDDQNLRDQGDSVSDLLSYLKDLGYRSFVHAESDAPVLSDQNFTACHFDLVAKR